MNMIIAVRQARFLVVAILLLGASVAGAMPVSHPGDFLVPLYNDGRLILYHPESGTQEAFAQLGPAFTHPTAIVREASGDFLVSDFNRAILRVSASTGAVSVVSQGGSLIQVYDIIVGPDGLIYEADGAGWILRIDPLTGAQTTITSHGRFFRCSGVAYGTDGNLYVADVTYSSTGLVRVDPVTGAQVTFTNHGFLVSPADLVFQPDGYLLVSQSALDTGELLGVNPAT